MGLRKNRCLVIRNKPIRLLNMRRTLALLLLLTSAVAHAQIGGYRVEVILFQNLQANLDAIEVESLNNFSGVPELTESSLPDDLEALTDKSSRMEGVWNRLRSSKTYRPLLYTSWVQNNIDYYPPFRIHDEIVIDSQIQAPTNIVVADLQAQDPLQAFRSNFYRLDGSVQLRLSRFLHINLDLEYRVPAANTNRSQGDVFSSQTTASTITAGLEATGNPTPGNIPASDNTPVDTSIDQRAPGRDSRVNETRDLAEFDIYRLKQSRQVKTDRLQYFDSPWFGALIMVIPIAAEPQPQEQQVQSQAQQQQVQPSTRQQVKFTTNNQ